MRASFMGFPCCDALTAMAGNLAHRPGSYLVKNLDRSRGATKKPRRLSSSGLCLQDLQSASSSGLRRLVDALDRRIQALVELRIALLSRQAFRQRAREARDHPVLSRQALVRLVARVPTRSPPHLLP